MAKKKQTAKAQSQERDSLYFLKIVLYLIVGAQWVRLVDPELTRQIPLPVGLVVGLLFASHDHFAIDRKIEYAVLLISVFVGFWFQSGLLITILE